MKALTTVDDKVRHFSQDVFFREAWADVQAALGAGTEAVLQRLALVVFKPECIATDRVADSWELLLEEGFHPVYWRPFTHDRLTVRELWRYRWSALPLQRVHLTEAQNTIGPSLLTVARYEGPIRHVPASVVLNRVKGPSDPARRHERHLRTRLGSDSVLINYLHAADEPLDIVREWGVLIPPDERPRMLARIAAKLAAAPDPSDLTQLSGDAKDLTGGADPPELDYAKVRAGLEDILRSERTRHPQAVARVRAMLTAAEEQLPDWREFVAQVRAMAPGWPDWNLVVTGAGLASRVTGPGGPESISDDGSAGWWRGEGEMVLNQRVTHPT
ncbi:hypothetical protein [Streptomyces sp. NPDC050164]|uniref:hypothetical protein n=1 Tax=Streptomyces sp. NPDC050164 TaxID=3365605 RepID=UPI0037ADA92B